MAEVASELRCLYFYKYKSSTVLKKIQALSSAFSNLPNSLSKIPTKISMEKGERMKIYLILQSQTPDTTLL